MQPWVPEFKSPELLEMLGGCGDPHICTDKLKGRGGITRASWLAKGAILLSSRFGWFLTFHLIFFESGSQNSEPGARLTSQQALGMLSLPPQHRHKLPHPAFLQGAGLNSVLHSCFISILLTGHLPSLVNVCMRVCGTLWVPVHARTWHSPVFLYCFSTLFSQTVNHNLEL